MSSIDLQHQQQKPDENNMLSPISNSGNSKEFCIASLLVPPVAPLDNDDDKTPTIKNHKAEAGPFDKDDNDVSVIISVNHPSEIQIENISANSIQSNKDDFIMKAIKNDDGIALKKTSKEVYHEQDNYYGIHNNSEKSLETMCGNYELRKEDKERCHVDDSIGQSSHPDTNDRNPSSIGDAELLDMGAGDDEITSQEPLGTINMVKGHLHPERSDKNSCKDSTSLLLNNYANTMMICQPKADTDYFSNSTLEENVANALLDKEQLAFSAYELNLKHSLRRSVKDEDKETKDCTGTKVKVNFESKENMSTSTDDALTEVSSVKHSNAGCTTEHVSNDGCKLGKQDVNKTNFISEAEEDSLQDQLSASITNVQVTTIAPADVFNMSLNNREPNLQDKSKETLDYKNTTYVNILIESCDKIPKNNVRNDADISFCARMSTVQCTEQPATSAGVSDHEDVCVHWNNIGTERQIVSTSPESKVSVINNTTTEGATAVESRSKFELDPPVADTNLATETFHDKAQLSDTAEVNKLRQKPLEGKVIDSQTYSTNPGAHVPSKGIDNKRMIGNPNSAVAQTNSFTIVKQSDAGDTIERSSDNRKELKTVDAYGSQFGTELEESSTQYVSFQLDTHTNNCLEGCSYSANNIHDDETYVQQTMLHRDDGQIRLNDEHFDKRPILSSFAVIESLDVTTVQPPARLDNQGKPETSIDNNDNINDRRETKSLLQEAIECLAESSLIYLLADLRLLSATGRIYTPYETINIDSDFIPKESVATLTASPSSPMFSSGLRTARTTMKGISPGHIIAVLLIELRREFDFASRNYSKSIRGDSVFSAFKDSVGHNMHRKHMISSMLWYSDMITKDLLHKFPKIRSKALRSHTKITTSMILERWQTLVKQNKDAIDSHFPVRHNITTTIAAAEADDKFEHNSFNEGSKEGRPSLSPRVNSAPIDRFSRTQLLRSSRKVARSILNNIQDKISEMKDENTKEKRQIKNLLDEFFDLGVDYTISEEELLDFMEKAVMSRVHDKFQFLSEFFQKDTITRAMVESKSKVVWLQDWYPLKELTYSISVNQEKKRVFVVFRGCTTVSDWKHALDARWKTTLNPVKEDFRGKKDLIKLHRGFFMYLFRNRKDNDTCKYDEIANVTHCYGKQIGSNYEVVATGHSLGAAMATLFSFYASTDVRFTKRGPVKCITFASPMVGGQAFADSFRHQERNKKLMLARFHNATDMFTRLPPNLRFSSRGANFVHTGVGVRLTRRYVKLIWIPEERFLKSYGRALGGFFLFHMAPGQVDSQHQLACHHKRILKFQKKYENTTASDWTLEEIYSIVFGDVKVLHEGCSFKTYFPPPQV